MRLFVGIGFPGEVREWLARQQDAIRAMSVRGRFPPREKFHLTLHFLGDTPEMRVEEIHRALTEVAGKNRPFTLSFGSRPGYFGQGNPARVVWLDTDGDRAVLLRLQEGVTTAVRDLGFPVDSRAYSPHVTLGREVTFADARVLQPGGRILYGAGAAPAFEVAGFDLFWSTTEQGVSIYRSVAVFPLCGGVPQSFR